MPLRYFRRLAFARIIIACSPARRSGSPSACCSHLHQSLRSAALRSITPCLCLCTWSPPRARSTPVSRGRHACVLLGAKHASRFRRMSVSRSHSRDWTGFAQAHVERAAACQRGTPCGEPTVASACTAAAAVREVKRCVAPLLALSTHDRVPGLPLTTCRGAVMPSTSATLAWLRRCAREVKPARMHVLVRGPPRVACRVPPACVVR